MGEVYKARDTRLDRIVAIKISAAQFSERFEREARAVAALNHPHICQIYDVGPNYLVMEHIEGVPLKGPLRLNQALKYAVQICDALDAAHRKGITHRDLKPANILVTPTAVKLLDFGLAKIERAVAIDDHTMTMALTGKGQILGTLHYISPAQLEGHEADARSDIFSFGLVLYEMLTGKRAFEGSSPASVIVGILEREAPSVADVAPLALERALRRCLEKDPENRWQSARDLKAELEWIAAGDFLSPRAVPRRAFIPWLAGAIAGAAGGAGIATLARRSNDSAFPERAIRFRLTPLEGAWRQSGAIRQTLALSPVNGRVAIIATNDRGPAIWVQRLDSLSASPLAGTEGAYSVFWSPDGKFIGFWADGKIKKIPAEGGAALAICDFPSPCATATWNRKGIVVTPQVLGGAPSSITVQSGTVTPIATNGSFTWPKFLPDGKHVLHFARDLKTGSGPAAREQLYSARRRRAEDNCRANFTASRPLRKARLLQQIRGRYQRE
jgi:tRNA A-37 threonylcarbamoyl transferase component Bud32